MLVTVAQLSLRMPAPACRAARRSKRGAIETLSCPGHIMEDRDMATVIEERRDILYAIYHRRAIRSYTAELPPAEVIRNLLDAAVQAPTAMHAEPWAFVVIQSRQVLKRLSDRSKQMLLDEVKAGSDLAPDVATRNRLLAMLGDASFNIFYDAGTLVVICRKPDGRYAEADCWLAAENLMLAACAKQLGTCCIGFAVPVLNAADVKHELGIPQDYAAVVPVIVGHPRGGTETVARKPPQILRWMK
jgi:nitroreductase